MATVTYLDGNRRIQDRLTELENLRLMQSGRLADLEGMVGEAKVNLARIEGAQVELNRLLIPIQTPQPEPEVEG